MRFSFLKKGTELSNLTQRVYSQGQAHGFAL